MSFFLRGVAEQAGDAIGRARRLQDLQLQWRHKVTEERASSSALRLADSLLDSPVLTVSRAKGVLGMTYQGALKNVDRLVAAGILPDATGGDARSVERRRPPRQCLVGGPVILAGRWTPCVNLRENG